MKHTAKTFTIAAFAALALCVVPAAKAADRGCSNASLQGSFADKDTGFIYVAANAAPVPFAGVNVETFDGNGDITGTGFASDLPVTPSNACTSPGSYRRPSRLSNERFSNMRTTMWSSLAAASGLGMTAP